MAELFAIPSDADEIIRRMSSVVDDRQATSFYRLVAKSLASRATPQVNPVGLFMVMTTAASEWQKKERIPQEVYVAMLLALPAYVQALVPDQPAFLASFNETMNKFTSGAG